MKRDISESRPVRAAVIVLAVLLVAVPAVAGAPLRFEYSGGVSATVYDADFLASRLSTVEGCPTIVLPDGRLVPVITDIEDPAIYNRGDGAFHPFTSELVDRALAGITHPRMTLPARIYLLPYPRRGVLVSSTVGNEVFLSPQVREIEPQIAAYIIAHELGHVFHNRYLPAGSPRWDEYRSLRGISDAAVFHNAASHANRPREIFAEDFRVLFGGRDAYFDGHIENAGIAEPEAVAGLREFYLSAANTRLDTRIAATCSPNPFNPETEIRITVPAAAVDLAAPLSVRVYSVTGALVRDLYDGVPAGDFSLRWNGTDNRGTPVASATYYAQVRMGDDRTTLKLVLLK
jgi:hypothetical protein